MFIKFKCQKCEHVFKLKKNGLKKEKFLYEDEQVELTKVICPKCGNVHVVQIDNFATNDLLSKIIELAILAKNSSYPKMKTSYKNKATKISNEREEIMSKLKQKYDGKILVSKETNEEMKVSFYDYEL